MAVGSTQPLTEMSTVNLPGGKGRPTHRVYNVTAICEPIVYTKCGSLKSLNPLGLSQSLAGTALPLPL
jgi:hypothetical protein